MAVRKINDAILTDIADAIRAKNGSTDTMTPPEMPGLIDGLETKAEFKKVKLPPVEQYGAVGYGNGKYIAHANSGLAAYSEDGVNWTQTEYPLSVDGDYTQYDTAEDIAYGNGVYVAAHIYDLVYSADGITWAKCTLPVSNQRWKTVCCGNGLFFAGSGGNGYLISSEDGITWTQVGSQGAVGGDPMHLDYGNGVLLFTGSSMGEMYATYSADGTAWSGCTVQPSPNGGGYATCYGGGKFVTLGLPKGYSGEQKPGAYSEDGINWTGFDLPFNPGYWTSVTYGNGVYIGVGKGESDADMDHNPAPIKKAIYSTDGINWQEIELPSAQVWMSVCYGDNGFVAISEQGTVAHSVDGLNWTEAELPVTTIMAWAVGYGDGKYVTAYPAYIAYSTDGVSWRKVAPPLQELWLQIAYGNGIFVITGLRYLLYSSDGVWWTSVEIGTVWGANMTLCFGNGKFLVGYKERSVAIGYSTDGINWQYTSGITQYVGGIAYGGGKFVEVSYRESSSVNEPTAKAGYSTDGITWTETSMPSAQAWKAVCYGKGRFVALAEGSQTGAYSKDGINWTEMQLPSAQQWASAAYGNGMFIATAINSDVAAYSMDGITWAETTMPLTASGYAPICYGDGKFVAAHGYSNSACSVCDVTKPLK